MTNILKVVRAFKGTAEEHEILKMSLDKVTEMINKAIKLENEKKQSSAQEVK